MTALLEARDIDFAYARLQVLFGVSLSVDEGEALALLGTNGAGKSTLLRVIAGLCVPSAGTVTFDGRDVTGCRPDELVRRGLVLVSGGRSVFPDMTVDENLELQALTVRDRPGWVAERRQQVFELFPALARRLQQKAGTMSGGEQQQLALAKAVLLDPKVLCIDELSLGLAPVVVRELMDIVRRLHEGGMTIVLVEQSLNIASELCGRALFMEKGEIRFEGRTADLLKRDDVARAVFLGGGPNGAKPRPRRTRKERQTT
ncbi:MAG: ABC transporter ATP-binding protein [Actinobacteria bacterium]|nr:ABC transporter ATP-binding protein [Actinomycetota bacterium]